MEREAWIKADILSYYRRGKDLEIRVEDDYYKQVEIGDILIINRIFKRKVIAIRKYPDFKAMLEKEEAHRILPSHSKEAILWNLQQVYKPVAERKGVLVFELRYHVA